MALQTCPAVLVVLVKVKYCSCVSVDKISWHILTHIIYYR